MARTIHNAKYKTLLKMLREAREAAGMTQEELALRLKTTQTFVSKSERGERRLDVLETFAYLDAVGLDPVRFVADFRRG